MKLKRFLLRSENSNESQKNDQTAHSPKIVKNVKLPTLTLEKFDGNTLKWLSFRESFESVVIANQSLSDVQKFQYLKAHLVGEASQAIEGLTLTNANFTQAMEILEDRYWQPQKIIAAYMRALWELPSPNESAMSLRTFSDELESIIHALKTLGKTQDSYGDLLIPIILDKLPAHTKRQMSRSVGDVNWTLDSLRNALQREVEFMLAVISTDSFSPPEIRSTATALCTKAQSRPHQQPFPSCPFCKGKHNAVACEITKDPHKRHAVAKTNRLCFNCLSPTHKVTECRSTRRCKTCNKKHHTSLCMSSKSTDSNSDNSHGNRSHQTGFASSCTEHVKLASDKQSRQTVLLKTAATKVFGPSLSTQAFILFDQGSTRSFITADLQHKLQLQPIRNETINIAVFGEKSASSHRFDVVSLDMLTKANSLITIEAVVVPNISTPMTNLCTPDVRNLTHLQGLELAHPEGMDTSFRVSVLIGADFYWSIVGNNVIKGDGPTAVSSKFGFLLSGPCHSSNSCPTDMGFHICATSDEIKNLWELETLGIRDPLTTPESKSDLQSFSSAFIEKREK